VIDPDQTLCILCPIGGTCDGSQVQGKDGLDVMWLKTDYQAIDGSISQRMRVIRCPPGYILVRDETVPDLDQCSICPSGKYSAVPALLGNVNKSTVSVNDVNEKCSRCPSGAECPGGNQVIPRPGYYRSQLQRRGWNRNSVRREKHGLFPVEVNYAQVLEQQRRKLRFKDVMRRVRAFVGYENEEDFVDDLAPEVYDYVPGNWSRQNRSTQLLLRQRRVSLTDVLDPGRIKNHRCDGVCLPVST